MIELNARFSFRQNQLFAGLGPVAVDKILAEANSRAYGRRQEVFRQGEPGKSIYFLVSGQVRISAFAPRGAEFSLDIIEAGGVFGEIAAIDGEPHTTSATAISQSEILVIRRDRFRVLLESDPDVALHMLRHFCGRLRFTTSLVEDSAFLDGRERLAKKLLSLVRDHGGAGPAMQFEISQADLAHFLGISRQLVNKYLRHWSCLGWIKVTRGRIAIRNVAQLQRIVASGRNGPIDGITRGGCK